MEYRYDVSQFRWRKEDNTFYGEAPHLECIMPDGNIHPEAFPNQKKQFYIDNSETGGFRRFQFMKEEIIEGVSFVEGVDGPQYLYTQWVYESEDGIRCCISID
jgi:hypothetical protein